MKKTVGFGIEKSGYIKIKNITNGEVYLLYKIDDNRKSEFSSEYVLLLNNK